MRPIAEGPYPIVTQGADGKTTLIVNTDGEYTYLGRLVVDFDANGDIIVDSLDDDDRRSTAPMPRRPRTSRRPGDHGRATWTTTAFADGTKGDKVETAHRSRRRR